MTSISSTINDIKHTTVVPQTKVAALGYFFLFASAVVILTTIKDNKYRIAFIMNLAVLAISIPIALYGINCAVVGKCELYAWIYGYLLFSYGLLAALLLLFSLLK
jgi:hypothetical protein